MSVNKVILVGNVGTDPEIRYLDGNVQNGQSSKVASLRLATTERFRDRSGQLQEKTEWHSIVAWRQSADIIEKYVKKGTQLYIEGRLRTREWTDQSGSKRYTTEITVDNLQLLGRRSDNENAASAQGGYQQPAQPAYQQPAPHVARPAAPQPAPVQEAVDLNIGGDETDDLPF